MKVLFLHADFIKVFPKQRAIKLAEQNPKELDVKEALVAFISVEKGDKTSLAKELVENIKDVAEKVKVNRIVLYPYVHLTNKPANPEVAYKLILEAEQFLKEEGFEVYRAPFGWYKEFEIKVKGHPLSELSRVIREKVNIKEVPEDKKEEKGYNKIFLILYPDGKEYMVLGEENNKIKVVDFQKIKSKYKDINKIVYENIVIDENDIEYLDKSNFNEDFVKLLDKEALGKPFEDVDKNPIREVMERFGFEWESLSDYGHMRYKPYAALLVDLIGEYSIKIATDLNFPVYIIKGTNMFDLEKGPVATHAKLYGDRLYELKTDKSKFVLRYAACFQQFSIAKDLIISYKDLPFGMLEIADSYRFEQPGETLLGFRLRKFWMPDLHVFCKNLEEASKYFYYMHKVIMEEMKKLNRNYELLINYGSPEFYLKYKDIAVRLVQDINKPALVYIYPPSEGRYWIINVEYHIVDLLGRPREIGTTQIDIGNGERFGIKYIDENNKEHYVVILHNAIIGSIERYIYALFDTALRKNRPMLPVWASPVQVRVIPVSQKHVEKAYEIAKELDKNYIRVEVDDRNETLSKRIMDAERLWVPYIVVVGDKEIKEEILSVRIRETGEVKKMKLEELMKEIWGKTCGMPWRPRYWPISLSKRPSGI